MGRKPLTWIITYQSLSEHTGLSINAIQQHVSRGTLVPDDLLSISCFLASYGIDDVRKEMFNALSRQNSYSYPGSTLDLPKLSRERIASRAKARKEVALANNPVKTKKKAAKKR